jgi:hypothetical protein
MNQAVFKLIPAPYRELKDQIDAGAVYIGLGDRFDDDRRLVRETAPTLRAGDTSRLGWSFRVLRA